MQTTHRCRSLSTAVRPGDQRGDAAQRHQERDQERPLHHPHGRPGHLPRLLLLHHRLPLPQGRLSHGGGPPPCPRLVTFTPKVSSVITEREPINTYLLVKSHWELCLREVLHCDVDFTKENKHLLKVCVMWRPGVLTLPM